MDRFGIPWQAGRMEKPQVTQLDTVLALVEKSKRRTGPRLRKTFLRKEQGKKQFSGGPLSWFVQRHDDRALDAYLLLQLVAVDEPFDVWFHNKVWGRALDISGSSGFAAVSRVWTRLVAMQLIRRRRERSQPVITLLQEDGSGDPYTPITGTADEPYLTIPLDYWRKEWFRQLPLRAKAMLLIALSLQPGFYLPYDNAPKWYGISPDTASRGLDDLEKHGLIQREIRWKLAPLAPEGYAPDHRYTLQAPFVRSRSKSASSPTKEDSMDSS